MRTENESVAHTYAVFTQVGPSISLLFKNWKLENWKKRERVRVCKCVWGGSCVQFTQHTVHAPQTHARIFEKEKIRRPNRSAESTHTYTRCALYFAFFSCKRRRPLATAGDDPE